MKLSSDKRIELGVLLPIALGLFMLSFVIRFYLADYPKGIGVLPDEIRYLDLASSILHAGELIQRGGISSFQKILYPLSIIPAYAFDDPQLRARLITALSCAYASSAVFPALVLARRLFEKKTLVIICMLLTLIVPDMCYSMTFLSESIYLPLALWLIACSLIALEKQEISAYAWSAGAGVLCYLAYLCKEVSLGFALSFMTLMLVRMIRDKEQCRSSLVRLACFGAGFIVPFFIMKMTLFSGLLNSYNQANPDVLLNPYVWLFALYALASDATHFIIAFAFFPLLLPLLTWRRLDEQERTFYVFSALSFIFILAAVVYTISIREDLGHVGIRPHVRYVAPLFLPLLFLFIKQVLRCDAAAILESPRVLVASVASTLGVGLLALYFIGTGDYSQGFDYAQFHIVRMLDNGAPVIPIDPTVSDSSASRVDALYHGSDLEINLGLWAAKAAILLFMLLGLLALLSRYRRKAGIALVCVIAAAMLANNYGAYEYNTGVYKVAQEKVDAVCALEAFVDGLPEDAQVLIVYDDTSSSPNNLMDVYIDNSKLNCNYIQLTDMRDALKNGSGSQQKVLIEADATMGDNIYGANGRIAHDGTPISYIIVNTAQMLRFAPSCAVDVTPEGARGFIVYQIYPDAVLVTN